VFTVSSGGDLVERMEGKHILVEEKRSKERERCGERQERIEWMWKRKEDRRWEGGSREG